MKAVVALEENLVRVLGDGGQVETSKDPGLSEGDLLTIYRTMLMTRLIDERMVKFQRQGRIAFYIGSLGEEAAIVGAAFAMAKQDWLVPCYRELGAAFLRGYSLREFFCQLFGNAEDAIKGRQMPNHYASPKIRLLSISSPVGTQIPHAVGLALAAKIRKTSEVVLVFFGEGATSQGDFHVSMNFAGVFKVPCVFMCRNNQWAISVPRERQTASESIAIKAKAYGFEGVQVDGNDVLAVYATAQQAFQRARSGGGPTLIEAFTYRMGAHSTSDDPRVYRADDEVARWKKRDPIVRFGQYLEKRGLWDKERDEKLQHDLNHEILSTLKEVEKIGSPPPESMFEDVFAIVPWHLREQRDELLRWIEQREK
ncbi:MAG TPA: pyruvate dehydrogenase (acetyl-transferring) E1 component subunit alpha [Acidobacteriota bacterium]|jgi:pyruvate dehydrogenase E1 component alpha subunit|nr:pyruvate dehydrogenase (acetyl-transferring) E1 component subunit alpha [Acidobacteriota bacterium]